MTLNEVLALGFSREQISIYLPPPKPVKITRGSKREGNKEVCTEYLYEDNKVHKILNHLKKYTSIKLG